MIYITGGGETLDKLAQRFASGNVNAYRKRLAECNRNTLATKVYPGGVFLAPNHPVWIPIAGEEVSTIESEAIVRELEFLPPQKLMLIDDCQKNGIDVQELTLAQAISDTVNERLTKLLALNVEPIKQSINLSNLLIGFSHEQLSAYHTAIDNYANALQEFSKYQHDSPAGYLAGNRFVAGTQLSKAASALHDYNEKLFKLFRNQKSNTQIPFSKGAYISTGLIVTTRQSALMVGRVVNFLNWSRNAAIGSSIILGGVKVAQAVNNKQAWGKVATQESAKITAGIAMGELAGKLNTYARARYAFMAGRLVFALSPWGLAFIITTSVGAFVAEQIIGDYLEEQIDQWWPE